jgi:tripartite-type tricarboxylate transporter receptor subunit TctC
MDPAIVKKIHDAAKDALYSPEVQGVMATYNMPTLYLDTAAYDKAAREQNQIEIDNLKRVGMLGKQ